MPMTAGGRIGDGRSTARSVGAVPLRYAVGMEPAAGLPAHVVMVGLMASGKSSVGRRLATKLGWPYRDSDKDIEAATGLTARELGEREGVDAMHALEARHLLEALAEPEPSVIGAAASTIEVPKCRAAMRTPGVAVVWLRAAPEVLAKRFDAKDRHRPEFGSSPEAFLTEQAERRHPLFASLDPIIIDVDRIRPNEAARRAMAALR
jgi:shikimate kinase